MRQWQAGYCTHIYLVCYHRIKIRNQDEGEHLIGVGQTDRLSRECEHRCNIGHQDIKIKILCGGNLTGGGQTAVWAQWFSLTISLCTLWPPTIIHCEHNNASYCTRCRWAVLTEHLPSVRTTRLCTLRLQWAHSAPAGPPSSPPSEVVWRDASMYGHRPQPAQLMM